MSTSPPPPPTPTGDVVDVLHGVEVRDPYRWLENGDADEVRRWSEEQGRVTRSVLDAVPFAAAVRARLLDLFAIGLVSPPVVRAGRHFHQRRRGAQEQPVLYVRHGREGADEVVLDPATLAADRTSALDWFHPSDDGRLLAYGISEGGSEMSVLSVLDVDAGALLDDVIPFTRACSLEWRPDGRAFFYTRYPEPGTVPAGEESYHRRVYEHVLGRDWREDPLVFGADRPPEDWPAVHLSPDGRWLAVSVSRGWTRTDVYLRDLSVQGSGFTTVVEGVEALFGVELRNDRLYLQTNLDAPRSRLIAASLDRPSAESWREVLPQGPDVLEGAALVGDWIVAVWLRDASSRVTVHAKGGELIHEVPLPVIGSVAALTGEWDGREAFLGFTSYTVPPTVYRLALPEPALDLWARAEGDVDAERFRVRLVRYPSHDGTPVSMFLVDARDRPADGRGPALLTGYGGFNVSHTPAFGRGVLLFLEQGGLYAVAHLRGGGEYGEDWHRQGMLDRKQNVFDDFLAAAEYLREEGHAAPDRLAMMGGSNGGLLVGAALTQRPDLFRAAVCQVPLLDMLRYHLFRIARLWIPEYGSAEDPRAFAWLHAYSPYHHVKDGTPYPAILLTTGESDSRVDPLHARKMAARLQAATSSGRPVLLRLESRAGHGQGKPLSKALEEWTDVWTFVMSELGMPALPDGGRPPRRQT
ncbi:MAG TPA: prolyl oligopeptidase family serine peptidase [Vicinamibacteria bacterium]|nr:prolyl oligopeptidase family serine peptidase [Vicinamibacteria bacterium]